MAHSVIDIRCPGCGAGVNTNSRHCEFCGREIIVSAFNTIQDMSFPEVNKHVKSYKSALEEEPDNFELNNSIGMCFLKLKQYDLALEHFTKAMVDNFEFADTYFYASVAMMRGKKAFTTPLADIKKIVENMNTANMIEPKGIYHYMLAYVKYDFYERKYLNVSPNFMEELNMATANQVTPADVDFLFEILDKPIPNEIILYN